MPVLRYFAFVGGALLALLLVCNVLFPQAPRPEKLASGSSLPPVRIASERKWPERIVFDTTIPSRAPFKADATQQTAGAVDGHKANLRDAFAQMGTEPKQVTRSASDAVKAAAPAALKLADATAPKAMEQPKAMEHKSDAKAKRRVAARVHPGRPMIIVAQQPQPHFGFFDSTW
jgi:hypothetical protein